MKYNIEKINPIGQLLAEVIEEAVRQKEEGENIRIGNIEMALRENLQAIGQSALKQFLKHADGESDDLERVWQSNVQKSLLRRLPLSKGQRASRWSLRDRSGQGDGRLGAPNRLERDQGVI